MPFDAQTFDAVILCYLAAVAAGSTDGTDMAAEVRDISGPPGEMFTFEQLPDAIEALQSGDDIDYEGAAGDRHGRGRRCYRWCLRHSRFTPAPETIGEVPVAAKPGKVAADAGGATRCADNRSGRSTLRRRAPVARRKRGATPH